jgi:ABC-2 type transport system permease protein
MSAIAPPAPLERRPISGPAAFGGDWHRFRQLLWLVAKMEFRIRYEGSVLGQVWSVAQPLMIFGVLYAVFTSVGRFGGEVPHYGPLLLMNIMLYRSLFSEATMRAVSCVVNRENLVRKMQFPRILVPLSVVTTSVISFGLKLVVLFAFMLADGVHPMWTWALFPVILLIELAFTTGLALLLSTIYVWFRDVAQFWSVITLILFFASPVIFIVEKVPGHLRGALFAVNPFVPLLEQARIWMIQPSAPPITDIAPGPLDGLLIPSLVVVGSCVAGLWLFVRLAPKVAERI